jgi:phosphate transport system permease protein
MGNSVYDEQFNKDGDMATYSNIIAAEKTKTFNLTRRFRLGEMFIQGFLFFCGIVSIFTTLGIVIILLEESLRFFGSPEVSLIEFFTKLTWQPKIGEFGIWPLLNSTLMTSTVAMLLAVPVGLAVAIYLSEYASERIRQMIKPVLEVLAGIPTVVYGYFALYWMTPLLRDIFGKDTVQIYNTASAGLVMGILLLPLIATISEDALHAVPNALREASYGLGATKLETSLKVVVPAAFSGIAAAIILGISRAVGETMIVAVAAGAGPNFTFSPFKAAETITGHIVRISGGDLSYDSIDYNSLFALALVLFLMTLVLNLISQRIVEKYREQYE